MVSTGAFNRALIDLIVSYCSFQCSGAGCGLSRDCFTGFCFFTAPGRGDLVLRFGSAASSSALMSATSSTLTRLVFRPDFGVVTLESSAKGLLGDPSSSSALTRFERRGAGVDPLAPTARSSAKALYSVTAGFAPLLVAYILPGADMRNLVMAR